MAWLNKLVEKKGAKTEKLDKALDGVLLLQEHDLLNKYKAHAILNATGLGS